MAADDLTWLMHWYLAQCDEDWEHQYGVTIDTLDNPGWSLTVDLDGTPLENRVFQAIYEGVDDENPVQGLIGDVRWVVFLQGRGGEVQGIFWPARTRPAHQHFPSLGC